MIYTVSEMAKLIGVPTSTLRYYDKEGLLPFVDRSEGGVRIFKDSDYEWLQVIECLKKTGMPLKEIKEFICMAIEGDATISGRLEIIKKQREIIAEQIEDLKMTLDVLDYKCWYYETAKKAGTTAVSKAVPDEELCDKFVKVRKYLNNHKQ